MDPIKSYQGQIKKIVEEVHKHMAPELVRESDQQGSVSTVQERISYLQTYGTSKGFLSQASSQSSGSIGLASMMWSSLLPLTWEAAVYKFNIPTDFREVSLERVGMICPPVAEMGNAWLKRLTSLYISGSPGSGKTFFFYALLKEIIKMKKYRWILCLTSADLDDELLKSTMNSGTFEQDVVRKYKEADILFLDDLGVERPTERAIKQYYAIIDHRFNNSLPTVCTSNLPADKIQDSLGDRTASRLGGYFEIRFPNIDLRKELKR